MSSRIGVVVVDDHPLFREGVVQSLNRDPDIQVLAEGSSADEAQRLVSSLTPDILLLDISIPGGGLQTAAAIGALCPGTKIVMLTASDHRDDLVASLRMGARGYVLKGVSARELAGIVKDVAGGAAYVPPALAAGALADMARPAPAQPDPAGPLDALSEREHEILRLVAAGSSNREIGLQLHLSEKTIKHYMTYIMQKLQVRNRVEAAILIHGAERPQAASGRQAGPGQ